MNSRGEGAGGRIGVALSGGGLRATVFHLGVLKRLADEGRLEDISFLSTVSGGSLCIGLLMALNGLRWPSSSDYRSLLAQAREVLLTRDMQRALIWRALLHPWRLLDTRAGDLSAVMKRQWGLHASLRDLPPAPRWMINATCYETGKNWRFERFRMGDYLFGYTNDTDLPLADALAASAGFPGLIGPLVRPTWGRTWFRYRDEEAPNASADASDDARLTKPVEPAFDPVHLWDGG
ncbi:MAG: patatin-like phospholipase family protein, partial [Anaerolineales bacterium]